MLLITSYYNPIYEVNKNTRHAVISRLTALLFNIFHGHTEGVIALTASDNSEKTTLAALEQQTFRTFIAKWVLSNVSKHSALAND